MRGAWRVRRSWALAAFVIAALLLIMNQGYWQQTLETLSLVLVSTLAATAIGIPVGIASAHHPPLAAGLRPVLDLMQTLPTFVYLIPTLVLFGLGVSGAWIGNFTRLAGAAGRTWNVIVRRGPRRPRWFAF